MKKMISIIVPIHNAERYLQRCVESILCQTYTVWELLLVDDGSTDATPQMCQEWCKKDERIRTVTQQNTGVSAARNTGIRAAKGQYIAFIDADDFVDPDYLASLFNCIQSTDLAICDVFADSEWSGTMVDEQVSRQEMQKHPSRYANPFYVNSIWNKLFVASIIHENGLEFPPGVKRCEDAYFMCDYLLCCKSVSVTSRKLYHYEQNTGSAMHRFYEGVCDDELPLMQKQYQFFQAPDLSENEKLAFEIWQYGKIMAVFQYIALYAPSPWLVHQNIKMMCDNTLVYHCLLSPNLFPNSKKAAVIRMLIKLKMFGLVGFIVRATI